MGVGILASRLRPILQVRFVVHHHTSGMLRSCQGPAAAGGILWADTQERCIFECAAMLLSCGAVFLQSIVHVGSSLQCHSCSKHALVQLSGWTPFRGGLQS